jgi:pSer/pThr/pTyr-binding forkhead associated (FHA) protein
MEDFAAAPTEPYRRWRVPASPRPDFNLPDGFTVLVLRLRAQRVELELVQPVVVVGRHTLVDLCLPYSDISRRHCRLEFVEGDWQVTDLESLNGVLVNGDRVQVASLRDHDVLQLGTMSFEVVQPHLAHSAPAPAGDAESQMVFRQIAAVLADHAEENRATARRAS